MPKFDPSNYPNVVASKTAKGATLVTFNSPTSKSEVNEVIHDLVKDDAESGVTRQIYIISGTHGDSSGAVVPGYKEPDFKAEDIDSSNKTRSNINTRDYHQTAKNRWAELDGKGDKAVIILAWCYSNQWLTNTTPNGNQFLTLAKAKAAA